MDTDSPDEVKKRAGELLVGLLERNGLVADDLISIILTATADITSVAPAAGIRDLGLVDVPLLCVAEMATDGGLPLCIRMMVHVESDKNRSELRHLFLRRAAGLRPDLIEEPET